jgi:hypothetical protein
MKLLIFVFPPSHCLRLPIALLFHPFTLPLSVYVRLRLAAQASWGELFRPDNVRLLMITFMLAVAQQLTGTA